MRKANGLHDCCENCSWWLELEDEYDNPIETVGECHRYAPRAYSSNRIESHSETRALWPHTFAKDFCGDYDDHG
jgi:hypothetical protein